jgi:hypothetical protein
MTDKIKRGGVRDPTLAKELTAERFSLEDILEQAEEQVGVGDIVGSEGEAMVTKRQIAANRKNAKRSTGPRTGAGKARSAMNSTRHGLLGQFPVIPGENPQEFSKFEEGTRAELKPEGAVEEYFFDCFIRNAWKLYNSDNVVAALLVKEESLDDLSPDDILNFIESLDPLSGRAFDRIQKIEKRMREPKARWDGNTDTQSARDMAELSRGAELESLQTVFFKHLIYRLSKMVSAPNEARSAQTEPDRGQGERDAPSADEVINRMARAFSRNRVPVALALRYRVKIERSRDNALHELQRFQAARHGQAVAAPEVVDVNVNFTGKKEGGN